MSSPVDPRFLALLRARLAEDMGEADRRAANAWDPTAHAKSPGATLDPEHAERGLDLMRDLLAVAPRVGVEPTSLILIQSQAGPAGRPTGDRVSHAGY